MLEAEHMAEFVRRGFADEFRIAVGELAGEDVGGGEVMGGVLHLVAADVGHAAGGLIPGAISADENADVLAGIETAGVFGGDVEVEGREMFRDAGPDFFDGIQFGLGEGGGIGILGVGGGGGDRNIRLR